MKNVHTRKQDRQVQRKLAAGGYSIVVGGYRVTLKNGIITKESV